MLTVEKVLQKSQPSVQRFGGNLQLFALLFGSSHEVQTIPWLLAGAIYLYLSYPGVQQAFVENEKSKLTPEQLAALEQLDAANKAAAAKPAPGMGKPEES